MRDCNCHMGLGAKCSMKVTTATLSAITLAQLSTVMGSGAPGDTRLANPTEFHDGDMILQLSAGRCHLVPRHTATVWAFMATGPCC